MAIAASKVKAVCTSAEVKLVRASRKPLLEQLSPAELKQSSAQARKLFDKWQGLARGQSRDRRRTTGSSDTAQNTELKALIFRDALAAFTNQLTVIEATGSSEGKVSRAVGKKRRTVEHRGTRAAVRKDLAAAEAKLNAPVRSAKPVAERPAAAKQVSVAVSPSPTLPAPSKPAAKAAKPRRTAMPQPKTKIPIALAKISPSKQRDAITAAKQSRLARSGKSGRMMGHVAARGQRNQARRDAKN